MATLSQLKTLRAEAGNRYAWAVVELGRAYARLAALDQVLSNPGVSPDGGGCQTFLISPQGLDDPLHHPEFAPRGGLGPVLGQIPLVVRDHLRDFTVEA